MDKTKMMPDKLDHSIRLYFPYSFDSNALPAEYTAFSNRLIEVTAKDLLQRAPFLDPSINEHLLESKIWQKDLCILDDRMHSFCTKLVNGIQNIPFSEGFFGMQPLRLADEALQIINQGSAEDPGQGLAVALSKTAIERLALKNISPPLANNSWPMMFNSVWFYGLNIGVGLMVVDVSFRQPRQNGIAIHRLEELQEINYVICRNSNNHQSADLYWENNEHSDSTNTRSIKGLSELVDALLPIALGERIQLRSANDKNHTYAYTFLASHQALDYQQRKNYIFRNARKYHELYLPDNTDQQIDYFEPFKPLTHAFSLEGATTYVDFTCCDVHIPDSLKRFHQYAMPLAYSPIILLTYAEYIFLREMATNTPDDEKVDMRNPTNENLSKLRDFRAKLYDFRLNFRYTQISSNTNHNLFCDGNKKALEIEKLLAEISSDAQEIEQYIADQVGQKQDVRLKRFAVFGSLFAVIIGWVELWGLNLHGILFENHDIEPRSITIFVAVLILLGVSVFYINRSPAKKKPLQKAHHRQP